MPNPQVITYKNGWKYFQLERLLSKNQLSGFNCSVAEYNNYLNTEAFRSWKDHIAFTLLLREKETKAISAYMSLIADSIKMSVSEKELHNLNYPFKTIPAMKVAKLAVDATAQENYKGIGSFMIYIAKSFAISCNNRYMACRFLSVDADIEHNANVLNFYKKNGFLLNEARYGKNRKTISMRKDIYF
jgi:ribosomal protein S18 acetylase RimI-like enzyme